MNNKIILTELNANWPPCVLTLNGVGTDFNQEAEMLNMSFSAKKKFCHSVDIVQGGYITAMLDAVMAYALMGIPGVCTGVATLEIKVNFIAPGHSGDMAAKGWVVNRGRSIGFLAGELFQHDKLIANATSTVKLIQPR